jgi:glycosyltransferase involved in cell wall biosynthesis
MKKLLYVTDQGEYVDHGFILPLFEKYLKEYFYIDIVYFTEYKSDFEKKDEHRFIMPSRYKKMLLKELKSNDIDIDGYSFVIVRNDMAILKHVLEEKKYYNYKTGFRLSFPKRRAKLKLDIAHEKATFLDKLAANFKNSSEVKVINQCDFFIPTSQSMHNEFFPDVSITSFNCPAGIDPENLHPNIQHTGEEKRFFYAGTLDKLRQFETVLEAFSKINSDKWSLTISTQDIEYEKQLLTKYSNLQGKVFIHNATNKDQLLDFIAEADVGVALLPDLPVFNTSTPVKTLDYYSSAVPCLMTNSAHIDQIFEDEKEAWFCKFTIDDIVKRIEDIIALSKEEMAQVGQNGQNKLLEIKNYKTIAKNLAKELETL